MKHDGFWQSIVVALRGIKFTFRTQRNMRWHGVAAIAVLIVAIPLGVSRLELAVLLAAVGLVWSAEILNTAIELMMDMFKTTEHPMVRVVKDVAAGGVLVTVITSIVLGSLILLPYLVKR